jgi:hypothetical protein
MAYKYTFMATLENTNIRSHCQRDKMQNVKIKIGFVF